MHSCSFLALVLNCGSSKYPQDVRKVLKQAGDNRAELEKYWIILKTSPDTLEYQAACFLIANMEGHSYATYKLIDSLDNRVEFNVMDYPDFDSLLKAAEQIEKEYGELDFDRDTLIDDISTIKADFLIKHIDYAFKAWRERPWAQGLSFDLFCQYVLPYRGSNEPLEDWRKSFFEEYNGLDSLLDDPGDPMQAARYINNDIRSWFTFDERFYYHPTDQGLAEMRANGIGRCEDMTNLAIFALRANGIAVTSDYTPYWANTGNNHAWNAIAGLDGKVIPFMGCESNPGDYSLANKLAKVYRKSFGQQKNNLIFQERNRRKFPGWLAGKSYLDVTADYLDPVDYQVEFEKPVPDSIDIAYLCVFNSGEWKAIDWARIENNGAHFTNFGPDVIYLPGLFENEEIVPFGIPFVPHHDRPYETFIADTSDLISITLPHTTTRALVFSTDGVMKTEFKIGAEYELFYWQDEWISLGTQTAEKQELIFNNVPAHGLYWLVEVDGSKDERIFSYQDGALSWW